ncbi:chorismate--pyruvate lyase family protein [Idiomarina xiamenensis]|uniref:Probable chorismate pyruvate-lyase n=1 Tax=Idiomarina xiamenensis 10-D-4 TaxID=740709 RepID=K2JDM9_9GAMM|nr:chorismate lyase [Idiomarina xiamenensis]EKE81506.1 4-hydroxybenzoate synthetase [Idiomarina xiamenensis 10-D-4]
MRDVTLEFPCGSPAQWRPAETMELSREQQCWLLDPQSLTAKLKHRSRQFRVSLIGQQFAQLFADEQRSLQVTDAAVVREVLLCCDNQPWVFARSILPESTLGEEQLGLAQLGDNPLGEHLFRQPDLTRSDIEVSRFPTDSAMARLNTQLTGRHHALFGRRSIFSAAGQQCLVAEIFLSPCPLYQAQ